MVTSGANATMMKLLGFLLIALLSTAAKVSLAASDNDLPPWEQSWGKALQDQSAPKMLSEDFRFSLHCSRPEYALQGLDGKLQVGISNLILSWDGSSLRHHRYLADAMTPHELPDGRPEEYLIGPTPQGDQISSIATERKHDGKTVRTVDVNLIHSLSDVEAFFGDMVSEARWQIHVHPNDRASVTEITLERDEEGRLAQAASEMWKDCRLAPGQPDRAPRALAPPRR